PGGPGVGIVGRVEGKDSGLIGHPPRRSCSDRAQRRRAVMTSFRRVERMGPLVTAAILALLALLRPARAAADTVFGPQTYERSNGAPQTFTATFERCGTGPCRLIIVNGNADGTDRVSSATIALNGTQ